MSDDLNAQIQEQTSALQAIVGELIDLKTGEPKKGATKEQMLFALDEIRKIQSIYDERLVARAELNDEFRSTSERIKNVGSNLSRINKKYGGKVFPKWFLEMFGA